MNYPFLKEAVGLLEEFDREVQDSKVYQQDISGFKKWILDSFGNQDRAEAEPNWEGKENGRGVDSVICTLLVHMGRFAKSYSKSAIYGSEFSSQEDFIYLINLKAFGTISKMDLIRKNVHEKPVGMQIINRLIKQGWVEQADSDNDKRSKVISITRKGLDALDQQMGKIRKATEIVSGDLSYNEKLELIKILNRLNEFHLKIYARNIEIENLLDAVN